MAFILLEETRRRSVVQSTGDWQIKQLYLCTYTCAWIYSCKAGLSSLGHLWCRGQIRVWTFTHLKTSWVWWFLNSHWHKKNSTLTSLWGHLMSWCWKEADLHGIWAEWPKLCRGDKSWWQKEGQGLEALCRSFWAVLYQLDMLSLLKFYSI